MDATGVVTALNGWLAVAAVLVPLVLAAGVLVPASRRAASALAPLAILPALALALFSRAGWTAEVPWLLLGTRVGLDATGRVFLTLTAVVFSLAALAARADADVSRGPRHGFWAFFLSSAAGAVGLALAQDAVTFYAAFALMSFPAYGLVVFDRRTESMRAGRVYIAFVVAGEALLVSGLFMAVRTAGTTDLALLGERMAGDRDVLTSATLILIAFAIKAGAVPMHVWLPPTYTQAPTPASAALAGAMSKAGVLGWLRFLPLGVVSLPAWGLACLGAGLLAAFYGVAIGLTQRHPKTVLAYSSVSQMGFVTATIGLGFIAPSVWPVLLVAVLAYALHHGLAKCALFLGAGVADTAKHSRSRAGVLLVGLALCSLSLSGAPLTSGALAKSLVKSGFVATGMPSAAGVISLMSLAAVGTTLLMARFLALIWNHVSPRGVDPGLPCPERATRADGSPWGQAATGPIPWALATAVSVLSPWLLMPQLTDSSGALTLATAWPVAAGVLISAAVFAAANRGWHPRISRVPAGDLLVVVERAAASIAAAGRAAGRASARMLAASAPAERGLSSSLVGTVRGLSPLFVECRLAKWRSFGLLFVALLFLALLLMAL